MLFFIRIAVRCPVVLVFFAMIASTTDLEPVHTFTTRYDQFFASSCIPTSNMNISAVHESYIDLLKRMNDADAIWLPIERRDLGGWHWLSGEFEGVTLTPGFPNHGYYAVLQAHDMVLEDVNSDEQYPKYLCQKTGSTCEANDGNCFVYDGTRYTIVVERGSWYEARAGCYKRGEQLASLPKANRRRLLEKIHEMTPTFPYIWVGLRRMDYFLVNRNTSVEEYKWRKGETCPCNSPHSCLALERTKEYTFFWKPRNCSESIHSVLCIQKFRPEEFTMRVQVTHGKGEETTEPHVTQERGTSSIEVIVGLGGMICVIMICVIMVGGIILKRYLQKYNLKLLASRKDNNKLKGELEALKRRLKDIEEKERQVPGEYSEPTEGGSALPQMFYAAVQYRQKNDVIFHENSLYGDARPRSSFRMDEVEYHENSLYSDASTNEDSKNDDIVMRENSLYEGVYCEFPRD